MIFYELGGGGNASFFFADYGILFGAE